jgi:4-hydroxy-tetrahydrodipicolinate synthase
VKPALHGVWPAAVVPLDDGLQPDAAKAIAYCRDLLRGGCDGVSLLGTTGEAMSLGTAQRMRFMEAMASSDLPRERLMVGTGASSLADAATLTRAAFEHGFAAALVMPPFFFRDASDDGIVAFFDALFARADPPPASVLLYNFPRMSGITFHPDLVDRLAAAFPGLIAGLKDSSNDAALQREIVRRHPGFAVFPGSEQHLLGAIRAGAAGCISATVCLWPQLAQTVCTQHDAAAMERLRELRAVVSRFPLVPAVRYLVAKDRNDLAWERPLPPLLALSQSERCELDESLRQWCAASGARSKDRARRRRQ